MLNQVQLIGNLGQDPILRTTNAGLNYATFSIATTMKKKDGTIETSWHNITAWGKLADTCNSYLRKGAKVFVQGMIRYNKYTDNSNIERISTQIHISSMVMLTPKNEQTQTNEPAQDFNQDITDDLPF